MSYRVGLTGGVGCGKSSVSRTLAGYGIPVIDADVIARQVVEPGEKAWQGIVDAFGREVLNADRTLNRSLLRQQVFADPAQRQRLDQITGPIIRREIQAALEAADPAAPYVLADIPLLVEKDYQPLFAAIVVVDCTPQQQLDRVMARDNSEQQNVRNIMRNQASRNQRLKYATHIVDNSGSLENLSRQVHQLHESLLDAARGQATKQQ